MKLDVQAPQSATPKPRSPEGDKGKRKRKNDKEKEKDDFEGKSQKGNPDLDWEEFQARVAEEPALGQSSDVHSPSQEVTTTQASSTTSTPQERAMLHQVSAVPPKP